MRTEFKICGITAATFAAEAERLGADYLGFIFAEGSPRRVDVATARRIRAGLRGTAKAVGVFTTTPVAEVVATARTLALDVVQLHRRATAEEVASVRAAGFVVWTLAGGAEGDGVLFDSSHGDGETTFCRGAYKAILAGGISEKNLAQALALKPDVIDVSGSLETAPGVKSIERLRRFFISACALRARGRQCSSRG
jgi:phosphoribosylanthranilate isomerase